MNMFIKTESYQYSSEWSYKRKHQWNTLYLLITFFFHEVQWHFVTQHCMH